MDLLEHLNIHLVEKRQDYICLKMEIKDIHKQPFGLVHGGINGVLIETACSMGAIESLNGKGYVVGVDLQMNHLKSAKEGTLSVIATPNHIGRTLQIWEANILTEKNELTCVGRCTLMNKLF